MSVVQMFENIEDNRQQADNNPGAESGFNPVYEDKVRQLGWMALLDDEALKCNIYRGDE